jgi:phage tail sheath protein FI
MSKAAVQLPGLYFTRAERVAQAAPLRSDVAGFAGRTRRGPVGRRVRVEGWNDYLRWFGGLDAAAYAPYGLRGYFENGGQVAHVVRVGVQNGAGAPALATATLPPVHLWGGYRIEASSPGSWANRTRIQARYRRDGASGGAELDLSIDTPGEPLEYLAGLLYGAPDDDGVDPIARQVASRSALVRLVPDAAAIPPAGPRRLDWSLVLDGGDDGAAIDSAAYSAALLALNDEPEIAILALPDLYRDLADPEALDLLKALLMQVEACRDRMLLVDAPLDPARANSISSAQLLVWIDALRGEPRTLEARAAAAYFPWLEVPDPLGGVAAPLRAVPPCGHVAGVISKLDRERGPHFTPANASLLDAIDLSLRMNGEEQMQISAGGINLLRCSSGNGLLVWGSSTLARPGRSDAPRSTALVGDHFIAYRRLIHRLVRAIRAVSEPLVFDTNGPELWLAFVRAVTTVLLEAWRGGALKGARPDEAFSVQCDDKTNPPEERELGRCVCNIGVAPVAPMEFIVFRVALSGEGALEVFES